MHLPIEFLEIVREPGVLLLVVLNAGKGGLAHQLFFTLEVSPECTRSLIHSRSGQ